LAVEPGFVSVSCIRINLPEWIAALKLRGLQLSARFVMVQGKAVDGGFGLETEGLKRRFDGTLVSALDLGVDEGFRRFAFRTLIAQPGLCLSGIHPARLF